MDFQNVALQFEGENNTLDLSASVKMPNALLLSYDLPRQEMLWQDGSLSIRNLELKPTPQHPINFGGLILNLAKLTIDQVDVVKGTTPEAPSTATITGLKIDSPTLAYKKLDINHKGSTLTGNLAKPIEVGRLEADLKINNIDVAIPKGTLKDFSFLLRDVKYQDDKGQDITAAVADIVIAEYKKIQPTITADKSKDKDKEAKDKETIDAKIALSDVSLKLTDGWTATSAKIENLSLAEAGQISPDNETNGSGQFKVSVEDLAKENFPLDLRQTIPSLTCEGKPNGNPLFIDLSHGTIRDLEGRATITKGKTTGTATASEIRFGARPKYWACEWDSSTPDRVDIDVEIPAFEIPPLTINGKKILGGRTVVPAHKVKQTITGLPVLKIHWKATLDLPAAVYADVSGAEFKIDVNAATKLCGGRARIVGALGVISILPTVRKKECAGGTLCEWAVAWWELNAKDFGFPINMALAGLVNDPTVLAIGFGLGPCN